KLLFFLKAPLWIASLGSLMLTASALDASAFEKIEVSRQTPIQGTVKDVNGETLIGVSILVKGTTTGTTTDLDGNFSISAPSNSTLIFTDIGFTRVAAVGTRRPGFVCCMASSAVINSQGN